MTAKFNKKSEEVVAKNPYWVYKHDKYELPNGEDSDYYYADINDFVMIVPVLDSETLVAIKEFRYLLQGYSIELPGGYCEDDKTIKDSAKSELKEETGYGVDKLEKVGSFGSSPGVMKNTTHVFWASVSKKDKQELDESEEIEVLEMSIKKFQRLIKEDKVKHGETLGAWTLVSAKIQREVDSFNI